MILKLFSVYDDKAKAYMSPFFAATAGLAIRSFSDAIADSNTSVSKYPADFTLFELGEFDDQTGTITPHPSASNLGNALSYKPEQ